MEGIYILIVLVSGLITGIWLKNSKCLCDFIQGMEEREDTGCQDCEQRLSCIAWKAIGESNMVTEFTYTTYCLLRTSCMLCTKGKNKYFPVYLIVNSILYVGLYLIYGFGVDMILFCLTATLLLYIGIVDWYTQYIPVEFNLIILLFGLIRLCFRPEYWLEQVIGLFAVSVFLLLVDWIGGKVLDKGHVVGGGDIKLMAAAGLLLGWKLNIVAFMMGCICGSVLHLIIMKIGKGERQLAFGPYLAMGIYIAMICGEQLMSWYLGIMGL